MGWECTGPLWRPLNSTGHWENCENASKVVDVVVFIKLAVAASPVREGENYKVLKQKEKPFHPNPQLLLLWQHRKKEGVGGGNDREEGRRNPNAQRSHCKHTESDRKCLQCVRTAFTHLIHSHQKTTGPSLAAVRNGERARRARPSLLHTLH